MPVRALGGLRHDGNQRKAVLDMMEVSMPVRALGGLRHSVSVVAPKSATFWDVSMPVRALGGLRLSFKDVHNKFMI